MEGAYTARAQRPAIGPAIRETFDAAIMPFRYLSRRNPERRHDVDERPGRALPELSAPAWVHFARADPGCSHCMSQEDLIAMRRRDAVTSAARTESRPTERYLAKHQSLIRR